MAHNKLNRQKKNSVRISLRLDEVETMVSIIQKAHIEHYSDITLSVLNKLDTVLVKIRLGARKSDYIPTPTRDTSSIEASLGMLPNNSVAYTLDDIMYHTKESYWEACYLKSLEDFKSLSFLEIQAAREYMYLHDLMTAEEMKEFEQETIKTTNAEILTKL